MGAVQLRSGETPACARSGWRLNRRFRFRRTDCADRGTVSV
jgi:hypothetical protein